MCEATPIAEASEWIQKRHKRAAKKLKIVWRNATSNVHYRVEVLLAHHTSCAHHTSEV
jgi:hypothetical protein